MAWGLRHQKALNISEHVLFWIMTTEADGLAKPIHDKAMPVMLMTAEDVDRWLTGKNVADAVEMQKPAQDEAIRIVEIEKAA